jgi:hypothetical protein
MAGLLGDGVLQNFWNGNQFNIPEVQQPEWNAPTPSIFEPPAPLLPTDNSGGNFFYDGDPSGTGPGGDQDPPAPERNSLQDLAFATQKDLLSRTVNPLNTVNPLAKTLNPLAPFFAKLEDFVPILNERRPEFKTFPFARKAENPLEAPPVGYEVNPPFDFEGLQGFYGGYGDAEGPAGPAGPDNDDTVSGGNPTGGTDPDADACCFTADTLITMGDGSEKPISKIKVGDIVDDSQGGTNKVLTVKETTLGKRTMASVGDEEPFMSSDHPIRTTDGWVAVRPNPNSHKELNVKRIGLGSTLVTSSGNRAVKYVTEVERDPGTPLFDLDLDDNNTYIANGIVVHNCDSGDGGPGSGGDGGSGACFVAGTMVAMSDGEDKPIEMLAIGDSVLSFPRNAALFSTELEPDAIVSLQVSHEDIWNVNDVFCSKEEWLIRADGTPTRLKWLKVGDFIMDGDGTAIEVHTVGDTGDQAPVYNFMTEKNYSYVADGIRTARGMAVRGENMLPPTPGETMAEAYEYVFGKVIAA